MAYLAKTRKLPKTKTAKVVKAKPTGTGESILTYAPTGVTLRQGQVDTLLQIEENWEKADVFVVDAPVAAGKSIIAATLARWLWGAKAIKSTIAVPNNILLKQYTDEFGWLTTLKSQKGYACIDTQEMKQKFSCAKVKQLNGSFCDARSCCYLKDVRKAQVMPTGVYNYHTLLAYRMYREVQIFDEAHNIIQVVREAAGRKLWRHNYNYPDYVRTYGQLHTWVSAHPDVRTDSKLKLLKEELEAGRTSFLVERTEDLYHGELKDVIKLNPVDVSDHPPFLWPEKKTKKLIMLSATMNLRDIKDLGLDKRRVMTISTRSPIPKERRPCIVDTRFNMSYHNQERELPRAAESLLKFFDENPERGFIHAPYSLAGKLAGLLEGNPRVLTHKSGKNKIEVFDQYKSTPGAILIASGMHEGVSLGDDLARWQVILKVPWPSLAEPAIKWKAENDEEWYLNECVKTISQTYGRVCRHEKDVGSTLILDRSFLRLWKSAQHLFPVWFKESVQFVE